MDVGMRMAFFQRHNREKSNAPAASQRYLRYAEEDPKQEPG